MLPLIVIIEDDVDIQTYLKDLLISHNFSVKTVGNGVGGLKIIESGQPDLVLLDLTLPDMDGESVCLEIRKKYPTVAIIMLTGKDGTADKVRGLTIGADDYITKPFATDELIARVKARLRLSTDEPALLKIGDLEVDTKKFEVRRGGKLITLTPREFKLLEYLMQNTGVILTREMILNRIWLYSPDVESRVVDVYMGYLRKKVDNGHKKKLLHSLRGFGYTIKE